MSKLLHKIIHGNVDEDFYDKNRDQLRSRNAITVKLGLLFSTIFVFFLFVFSYTNPILEEVRNFYIIFLIWFAFWTVMAFVIMSKHHKWAMFFDTIFAGSILLMTALAGTYFSQDHLAVIYFIFLIFIPGLYVNRPTCCITTITLSSLIFMGMVFYFKTDSHIISVDIINTIFTACVSIVFNVYSTNTQLENIQASINLKKLSTTDDLTKLPNRRSFNNYIESCFHEHQEDIVVYMMDIDFFKRYNDTYGHVRVMNVYRL